MSDMSMKLACVLAAATFLVGGCSGDAEATDDSDTTTETSLTPKTTPASEEAPSDTGTGDSIDLAGKWTGKMEASEADLKMMEQEMPGMDPEQVIELAEGLMPKFELREDGTYTMELTGQPFDDTWTLEDDTLTLASTGFTKGSSTGGVAKGNGKPMVLTVSEDGSKLIQELPGEMTSRVVYSRD